MQWVSSVLLAASLLAVPVAASSATFNRDIAPLVFKSCSPCHHLGGVGPFPLLTYQDVRRHASQIVDVTKRRYMPPWPPEPVYGEFLDSRRLSNTEIQLLSDWVRDGAPEGNGADLPPRPNFTSDWQMGTPDLIAGMPESFTLGAEGKDVFRNFLIPTRLKQTRYVRGVELRFNDSRAVHHANIVLDRTGALRKRDGEDGRPGFPGMDVITEAAPNDFDPDSHFLFWKPGSVLHLGPEDMSWRLDPGTDLIVNLHLQPTGKPEQVRAQIGLYFAAAPPTRFPMLVQLEHDGAIDIPPGDKRFVVTDQFTLPVDGNALAIYPHAHYLGKTIEAWATLPDGRRRPLIRIPDWDINWQGVYEFKSPIFLPKGTKLEMSVAYDNSAANLRNLNSPPKRVRSGDRSEDEMGHVWLQILPVASRSEKEDARVVIQQALMERRLEKYPADFLAHYNLGAVQQMRGNIASAISSYVRALNIEPRNAGAHNSLGAALLLDDRAGESIVELRRALELDPSYLNARYNLARALAVSGDLNGAATEYADYLKLKPDDAEAQAGLGSIFFLQHRYADALPYFRESARLNPKNADVQANLGTVLAILGDISGAIAAYQNALSIDPEHAAAKANLAQAQAQLAARPETPAAKPR